MDANPIAGNQPDLELYVFDPVGTHGLWSGLLTVVGRSPLPTTFMGYNTGGWANCIRRARVILMEGENRASFEPNVYRVQHPNLQQVWPISSSVILVPISLLVDLVLWCA